MNMDDLKDVGLANLWNSVPEIVCKCKHTRLEVMLTKDIRETYCKVCGFKYQFDIKKHLDLCIKQ